MCSHGQKKSISRHLAIKSKAHHECTEVTRFSQNTRGYVKNHWTNTRLVSTHLNVFSC